MVSEENFKTTKDVVVNYYVNDGKTSEPVISDVNDEVKLQLREEQLDIAKRWIQTSDVTIYKRVFTEEKIITVPVTREEIVVERKILNADSPNKTDEHTETIRIPISEEQIDITKHRVALEDVEIYKRQFQEVAHIEETLKKEKLNVKTTENLKVIDNP